MFTVQVYMHVHCRHECAHVQYMLYMYVHVLYMYIHVQHGWLVLVCVCMSIEATIDSFE